MLARKLKKKLTYVDKILRKKKGTVAVSIVHENKMF